MAFADLRKRANNPGAQPVYGGTNAAITQAGLAGAMQNRGMGAAWDSLGMARDSAMGRGPSLAQQQLQAGSQANLVNQMGLAAAAPGSSLAAQQRQVAGMGSAGAMALNRDAAQLRAQEMQAAQAAYASQAQGLAGMGMQSNLAAQQNLQNAYGTQYQGQMDWALQQRAMDQRALEDRRRLGMQIGAGIFEVGKSIPGMMTGGLGGM